MPEQPPGDSCADGERRGGISRRSSLQVLDEAVNGGLNARFCFIDQSILGAERLAFQIFRELGKRCRIAQDREVLGELGSRHFDLAFDLLETSGRHREPRPGVPLVFGVTSTRPLFPVPLLPEPEVPVPDPED